MTDEGSRRGDLLAAAGVALGVFLVQLPFRLVAVNLIDEGAIYQFADELLRGKLPYTDVVHPAFPGVHYVIAAVFAVFGSSWMVGRTFGAVVFAVTAALVFLIARWWSTRRGALALVVLFVCYRVWAYPHWHMVSYSSLAVTYVLAAVWLAGEALVRPRSAPLVAAGLLAGCAMLTKQDSGALGSVAIGLALLAGMPRGRRIRSAATFSIPAFAVLGAAVAAAVASGVFDDLVRATILNPLQGFAYGKYQDLPPLWPFWAQDAAVRADPFAYLPTIVVDVAIFPLLGSALYQQTPVVDALLRVVYHLPWIVLVASVVVALARRMRGTAIDPRETLLLLLAAGFLLAFNKPRDWIHLLVLYPPTLLLMGLLATRARAAAGRWRSVVATAIGVVLAIALGVAAWLAIALVHANPVPVTGPRGTIYATGPQGRGLQAVVDAVADVPPDVPLLSLPYHPGVNYLTGRPNLSRYYVTWPAEPDVGRSDDFIAALERHPNGIVVYTPTQVAHFPRMSEYDPPLFSYLVDHYELKRAVGGEPFGMSFFLLERRPAPGGSALGGERLGDAKVVLAHGGTIRPALSPERTDLVREVLWPFCRATAVGLPADTATALRYRVTPTAQTHLRGSFGINPDHWAHLGQSFTFTITVEPAGEPPATVVDRTVDVLRKNDDRAWHPIDVDLSAWAGRPVDVTLQVDTPTKQATPPTYAAWCDLRLDPE